MLSVTPCVLSSTEYWLLAPIIAICSPLPAVFGFHVAWEPKSPEPDFTLGRFLLFIPTTIPPVVLLLLHGFASHPDWQAHGPNPISYIALGNASWVFLLPFTAANYVVARTVWDRNYLVQSHLPPLALLTCLLICLYFAIGNWDRDFYWCFPLSAACGYGYGLKRLLCLPTVFHLTRFHAYLMVGWFASAAGTVYGAVLAARSMIATLPEEKPDCFIVTAASKGHPFVVGSWQDSTTGRLVNHQLRTFRNFEQRLVDEHPSIHRAARKIYNVVGPIVARCVIYRWQADLIYLALKPLELLVRGLFSNHPSDG